MLKRPAAMIILDTNVVSELTSFEPAADVVAWLSKQVETELFITSVNEAELSFGVERLPGGRRRNDLATANERIINGLLGGRVLVFDRVAAGMYAVILANRERIGRPIGELDCMIAAIARAHGATVATRDMYGFENCGVEVVNPWSD